MDGYGLAASLVSSLAWPTSGAVIAFGLRNSIRDILRRITSFKGGGLELTVAEASERIAANVEGVADAIPLALSAPTASLPVSARPLPTEVTEATPDADDQDGLDGMSDSATGRILTAWIRMERRLSRLLLSFNYQNISGRVMISVTRAYKNGLIPLSIVESIIDLNSLRNRVAHGRITVAAIDADAYEKAILEVGRALDNHMRERGGEIAAGIQGQGELASMNYNQLTERLKTTFPFLQ